MSHFYDFSFKKSNDDTLKLSEFQGKVVIIVNTASKCGFTKQYEGLQRLYEKYQNQGLVIIAVPSNDFGSQEPADNPHIQSFCKREFGVTFPIVMKEVVKGKNAHPFYKWAQKNLKWGKTPRWNFHKFVIDRDGKLVDFFYPITSLESSRCIKTLEKLLSKM